MCQYVNYVGMVVEVCGIIEIGFTLQHLCKTVNFLLQIDILMNPMYFVNPNPTTIFFIVHFTRIT